MNIKLEIIHKCVFLPLLAVMFFSPLVLKAQRTEDDFKWLFFSRIEQLDRIEGIYDLSL